MYMTVLKANHESLQNREYLMDFSDMEFIHRWLTSQMDADRQSEHILFSIKYQKRDMFFYIQSDSKFPLKNVERAGMFFVKSFSLPEIHDNDQIIFNLFCSADKTTGDKRRTFIQEQNKREEWLINKTKHCLAGLKTKEIRLDTLLIKNGVKVPGVEFTGIGTVSDAKKFKEMVQNGIGRCKNYGFGLMLYKGVDIE